QTPDPPTTTLTSSWPDSDSSCSWPTAPGGSSNQLIPKASTPSARRTNLTAPPGPAPPISATLITEYPLSLLSHPEDAERRLPERRVRGRRETQREDSA